ncbi:DUF3237 domain-containing protein [Pseudooceanicola onchidii]|uniref:DUF3237 domain-containing protein n=1 Tax=Pseudooceanicola onchidii TaxID=2562279 RepID=UPI0010AAF5DE|nr:DUF3237 domain-containing protein [Pseudooceanicola onchidii]
MTEGRDPLIVMHLDMGPAQQITDATGETRLIYHVKGGHFTGPRLKGRVLPVTGDWVRVKDGAISMDVRVELETDDGDRILMVYESISDLTPEERERFRQSGSLEQAGHYFRVSPKFLSRSDRLSWLTAVSVFGVGTRYADHIDYHVFEED